MKGKTKSNKSTPTMKDTTNANKKENALQKVTEQ